MRSSLDRLASWVALSPRIWVEFRACSCSVLSAASWLLLSAAIWAVPRLASALGVRPAMSPDSMARNWSAVNAASWVELSTRRSALSSATMSRVSRPRI